MSGVMRQSRSGLWSPAAPSLKLARNPELAAKFYWAQEIHWAFHPLPTATRRNPREPDPQARLEQVRHLLRVPVETKFPYWLMREKIQEYHSIPDDRFDEGEDEA